MGEPGPLGAGEGAAGLGWLLDKESGGFRGGEQAGLDLVAGEDAAGDQTVVGNLVDDPELRFTNTGIAVTNLRVAVTQRIQQDGEWRDGDTSFLKVNVWRGQAEHLADSLAKGDRVMVTGRLRQRSWETPKATSGR